MTNDGKNIYQSDGTEKIGLPIQKPTNARLQCVPGKTKIKALMKLNISTEILCKCMAKDAIAVVNPKNGAVEGILDMSGLRKLTTYPEDVLNGIAYNPKKQNHLCYRKTGIKCSK
jgi:glutamine cyclotransferase